MAKRSESEYVYASAYIGTLSQHMMTNRDIMRVATSKDLESAEVILREYGYGEAKELREGDIETFIRREQGRLFEEVRSVCPDWEELKFNQYPFDYHNIKVCLKSEQLGMVPDKTFHFMSSASIPVATMIALIRDRNYSAMPIQMERGITEALDVFARSRDPQMIDIILDKACYRHMLDDAENTENEYLIEYVKKRIDAVNLSSFVRLREMGKSWNFFKEVFIPGGHISEQTLVSSYDEPYSRVAEKVEPHGFGEALSEGGRVLKETGQFYEFEKLRDAAIMHHMQTSRFQAFGIEQIMGVLYGKEKEIDNLRIALTGKLFGFEPEEIEERLKVTYV